MSFEKLSRKAIEVVFGAHANDPRWPVDSQERWLKAARIVLKELVPNLQQYGEGVELWPDIIRDELFRLQQEEGLDRRTSVGIMEKRMECIIRTYRSLESPTHSFKRNTQFYELGASFKRPLSQNQSPQVTQAKRNRILKKRTRDFSFDPNEQQ